MGKQRRRGSGRRAGQARPAPPSVLPIADPVVDHREIFARICSRLAGAASSEEVMVVVTEETDRLFGWDCCYLVHQRPGTEALHVLNHIDTQEDGRRIVFPGEERLPTKFSPAFRRALTGEAVLINRQPGSATPRMLRLGTSRRSASLMIAPIRSADRVIGALTVQSYTPGRYSESELVTLKQIANAIAPALERVRAEDALRISEARYRLLVEQSPAIIFMSQIDETGGTLYASPGVEPLLGYAPEVFTGTPAFWIERLHPEDRDRVIREMIRCFSSQATYVGEYRMIARDGRILWFHTTAVLVRDAAGSPLHYHGVATDITALRQAQELVRLQRDLGLTLSSTSSLADALESVLETTFRIDGIDCGGVYLVGENSGELLLMAHKGLSKAFAAHVAQFASRTPEGQSVEAGKPMYFGRGQIRDPEGACEREGVRALASIPILREGRPIAVLNLASRTREEISPCAQHAIEAIAAQLGAALVRIRAEEALRDANRELEARVRSRTSELSATNERLRREIDRRTDAEGKLQLLGLAVESSAEAIAVWNAEWQLTYSNAAFLRMLGRSDATQVEGSPWTTFIAADRSVPKEWVDGELEKEGRWQGGLRAARADGTTIAVTATFSRFQTVPGASMILGSFRDDSEEELHLAQIRQLNDEAQKRLEEERARIARELHDELGQAVTALNMQLASVRRHTAGMEPAMRERIASMDEIAARILESVRDLSRAIRSPAIDHVGVVEVIRSHAAAFEKRCGITCRVQIQPNSIQIPEPLGTAVFRIVQEALTNIARHSRASACEIDLLLNRGTLEVRIRDNGVGAARTVLAGKCSLGLVGMRERVASTGGSLRIESTPGKGVCITARLPFGRKTRRRSAQ